MNYLLKFEELTGHITSQLEELHKQKRNAVLVAKIISYEDVLRKINELLLREDSNEEEAKSESPVETNPSDSDSGEGAESSTDESTDSRK